MAPETRAAEIARIESTLQDHDQKFTELRDLINGLGAQQSQLLQKFAAAAQSEASQTSIPSESKPFKVEFPRFDGTDVKGWLNRCQQFFDVSETLENEKMKLATINLEGPALQWHQSFPRSRSDQPLSSSILLKRFGGASHGETMAMADLKQLKQTGTLQEYTEQFDALSSKLVLSDEHLVGLFLGGLRPAVQYAVSAFRPKTLFDAVAIAKLQDSMFAALLNPHLNTFDCAPDFATDSTPLNKHPTFLQPPSPPSQSVSLVATPQPCPTKTLFSKDFDERRAKGLCLWCDSKFIPGHKCPRKKQVYLLEVDDGDVEEIESSVSSEEAEIASTEEAEIDSPACSEEAEIDSTEEAEIDSPASSEEAEIDSAVFSEEAEIDSPASSEEADIDSTVSSKEAEIDSPEEAILHILSTYVAPTEKRNLVFTKVDCLLPGTDGHSLILKVVSSKPVRFNRFSTLARPHPRIAESLVGDETGSIIFTARNEQVDIMKRGATVILYNAKIDMFKGNMRLAVDRSGCIAVTGPTNFTVKEDNNLSSIEYEIVNVTEDASD